MGGKNGEGDRETVIRGKRKKIAEILQGRGSKGRGSGRIFERGLELVRGAFGKVCGGQSLQKGEREGTPWWDTRSGRWKPIDRVL